jgi:hypothetical protein
MGLPVILGVEIEGVGGHAITIAGYSISDQRRRPQEVAGSSSGVNLVGLRLDAFFSHDDHIGPFSKVVIKPAAKFGEKVFPVCFESDWVDQDTGRKLPLYPHVVIVPVYHKIRLTFLDVMEWLTGLNAVLKLVVPPSSPMEWDVHLMPSNEYKKLIRATETIRDDLRERILLTQQPRFIWRAKLLVGGVDGAELLFDATGISRSFPMHEIVWLREDLAVRVKQIVDSSQLEPILVKFLTRQFLDFIKRSIHDQFAPPALFPGNSK